MINLSLLILVMLGLVGLKECGSTNQTILLQYNTDLILSCQLNNVSFYKKDTKNLTSLIVIDNSKYFLSSNLTLLIVKSLKVADISASYFCNSSTTGDSINFISNVIPYQYQLDVATIGVSEDGSASLSCYLLVGSPNITWIWTFNNQPISSSSKFQFQNNNQQSTLSISNLLLSDKGDYYCNSTNQYGSMSRSISLKVKSRLAPLWPFLGVVGEVLILIFIIIIYEKKFKNKTKSPNESNGENKNK